MSCSKARHLTLSMLLTDQGCKWYWPICEGNQTITVGHLQWTGIPSKKSSNTPGHFCHRNWSRAPVLTIHLASLVPWEWNRLLCPVASEHITGMFSFLATTTGGDLVSCMKQTFHHLSPAPFTEYIAERLSEGGKGHLFISTYSKQLCNR